MGNRGSGGLGRSGELSGIIAVLFFGMIEIHFPPQRVVISVSFLRGFGKLFDIPRKL